MQKLYVNNYNIVTENFRGFNFVHQMYEYMPDNLGRELTPEMIKLEYEIFKKMRVKNIRSFYGSSLCWDNVKKEYDFESPHMQAFYKSCLEFQEMGIEIGITPQWQFKGFLVPPIEGEALNTINIGRFYDAVENDIEATAKNFEKFIELSVKAFEAHGIHNIKYFYCFTECNNTFNGENKELGKQLGLSSLLKRDYLKLVPIFRRFIEAVDNGLKAAGKRDDYKIVAPCDNWRADDGSEPYSILVKYCCEHLADKVDIIGSHNGYDRNWNYRDDDYYALPPTKLSDPLQRAKAIHKDFWVDEYNVAMHNQYLSSQKRETNLDPYKGLALGAMVNSIMNMGYTSNLMIWTLFDQQWPDHNNDGGFDKGVLVCGYYHNLLEKMQPTPSWYSAALISRYVGAGEVYECKVGESTYISAIKRTDGEYTLVVTNYNNTYQTIKVDFAKGLGNKTFYRYSYNPATVQVKQGAELPSSDKSIDGVDTLLEDLIPAMSVAVYTTEKPN